MKFDDDSSVSVLSAASIQTTGASKWALVIGIADYEGTDLDLWHPDEDAKEMYAELTKLME